MTDQDAIPVSPYERRAGWAGLLFWLGTLCLWIPPLLLVVIGLGGGGMMAFYGAVSILDIGVIVTPLGLVMLIAYAVIGRPWRRPLGTVWIFWLELLVFILVLPVAVRFLTD